MTEHDGLSLAPVFIIDVDVSAVFFSNGYVWHDLFSFLTFGRALFPIRTKCGARFHRSKLRSDSLLQHHDLRRTRCALRADARPAPYCLRLTRQSCPMDRHTRRRYQARAEDARCDRST